MDASNGSTETVCVHSNIPNSCLMQKNGAGDAAKTDL